MGILEGRFCRWTWIRALGLLATLGAVATHAEAAYVPTSDDRALLAFTNLARAEHNLPPLVWHDGLGRAAYDNSSALAARGGNCDPHSCGGEWWRRIQRHYPGAAAGENVASNVPNPRVLHDGWMTSTGHRANILSSYATEFGASIMLGQTNVGTWAFATEDFGSRSVTVPTLPAGGIAPRIGYGSARELVVNYYHPGGGAPRAVHALVGSSCVALSRMGGSATNGTYGTSRSFTGNGCVPVVFEAVRSDGVRVRWPENTAILVGVGTGGLYCAETTTAVPTQNCSGGGDPAPTPTPNPAPTPNGSGLSGVRVVMRPGRANASKGQVQVQGTLPAIAGFDPSGDPLTIRIRFGASGDWSRTIPAMCADVPCLKSNKQATSYRATYQPSTASLVRTKAGTWKLRFVSRNQTLSGLSSGTVSVTVVAGGRTFTGSANGELKESGLVAD